MFRASVLNSDLDETRVATFPFTVYVVIVNIVCCNRSRYSRICSIHYTYGVPRELDHVFEVARRVHSLVVMIGSKLQGWCQPPSLG
jgi:hypothetical protein